MYYQNNIIVMHEQMILQKINKNRKHFFVDLLVQQQNM